VHLYLAIGTQVWALLELLLQVEFEFGIKTKFVVFKDRDGDPNRYPRFF
jgi:hypothetical protein